MQTGRRALCCRNLHCWLGCPRSDLCRACGSPNARRFTMVTRRTVFLGAGALVIVGAGAAYGVVRDMGSLDEYEGAVALTRATLRQKPEIGELLRHATLAPSGHNTQPGTFRATGDRIHVVPDLSRRTPIVDPDDHHLFVGLGCAAENLALASSARGRPGELRFDPSNVGSAVFEAGRERQTHLRFSTQSPSANPRATTMTAGRSAARICEHSLPRQPFQASI
jgi:hypothetical protein